MPVGPGPAIQALFKYEPTPDASVSLKLSYARQHAADHFTVRWYDSLTTTTDSAALSAERTWTGLTFGPYIEKYFTFNWQTDDRKFLKNLFPYLGAGLDFHFIVQSSSYSPPTGAPLPGYLSGTYGSGTQLLPPTFGATLRIGSKVRLSPSGFLDLFGQYSALIPEETRKGKYLNHHVFVGIGYEQEIVLKPSEGKKEKK